ncbi:Ig-like domain-containing protein, partial [Burkholderia ubonensis]|uniref:Ig-like domain-containing protein n=1 Tax=Burkholderia ubonensis TaxID=101571 RepID=UPI0018DF76B7
MDTSGGGVGPEKPAKPTIEDIYDNTDPANPIPVADGDTTKDKTPVIGGSNGTPGNTIIVIIDDKEVGTAIVGDDGKWKFETPDDLADGEHKYEVIERDPSGNESDKSDPVKVIVDSPVKPVITEVIDNEGADQGPINPGDTTDDAQPVINGTAKAGSHIEIYDGDTLIGTTTADENGNWTFKPETPLADGHHYLTAVATDPLHGSQTSDRFDFTVDFFRSGLMYGWDDLMPALSGGVFQIGETRQSNILDIKKIEGSGLMNARSTGMLGLGSDQGHVKAGFDLKGKVATALSLEIGYAFDGGSGVGEIIFYDAAGNSRTFDLPDSVGNFNNGIKTFIMPEGFAYTYFEIYVPVRSTFNIASVMIGPGELVVDDLNPVLLGGVFEIGEVRQSSVFDIKKVDGSGMMNPRGFGLLGLGGDAGSVKADFDLKGKAATILSMEVGYTFYGGGVGKITFYDADGNERVFDLPVDGSYGIKTFTMPEGFAYTHFEIFVPQGSTFEISALSPATPVEWPHQPENTDVVGTNHDLSALDGLGGDVFYVNEGDEDAISFTGTDGLDLLKLTGEGQVLDLSNLQGKLASIEAIDLTGTGANTLKL